MVILYFWLTFDIDLNIANFIGLDNVLAMIGLKDCDIANTIWNIFYDKGDGKYLGEDVYKIVDDYKLIFARPFYDKKHYFKKLVKR